MTNHVCDAAMSMSTHKARDSTFEIATQLESEMRILHHDLRLLLLYVVSAEHQGKIAEHWESSQMPAPDLPAPLLLKMTSMIMPVWHEDPCSSIVFTACGTPNTFAINDRVSNKQ
jgi:hypothetical protein